jgi:hypothetical protein
MAKKIVNPFEEQDKLLDAQRQRYATLRSAAEKKKLNDAWEKKQNDIKSKRVSAWYSIPQDTETLAALEKEWNDAEAEYKQNLAKAQDLNTYYAEIPGAMQKGGAHRDVWAQADPITGAATGKEVYTDTLKPAGNTKPTDSSEQSSEESNTQNGTPQGRDGKNTASNKAGTEDSDKWDAKKEKEQAGNTSLYTGLSTYLAAKATPGGAAMAPNEDHLREQAVMHDKQSGDEQKNAQRNFQIANRDYRVEAEKNAASQAASKNAQKVSNLGNASAGAAALERGVEDADYNTHMARSDSAHKEGVLDQREMWGARQTAEEERANANKENHDYLEQNLYNSQADTLSKGGKPDIVINNNGNQNTQSQQQPQQEPPQQQQPQQPIRGDLHKLLNYITYSRSKPEIWNRLVQRHQDLNDDDKKLYAYLGSPPPLSANQLSRNNTDESVPELAAANVEPYKKFWNFYMQEQNASGNRKGTQDENGNWVGHENASSRKDLERYDSTQAEVQDPAVPEEGNDSTSSDARIKNIVASMLPYYNRETLSDGRMKNIVISLSSLFNRR